MLTIVGTSVLAVGLAAYAAAPVRAGVADARQPPTGGSVDVAATAGCAETTYDCAMAHVERQQFTDARAVLERLLARSPRDLRALNLLGITLTSLRRYDQAASRLRQALAMDPAFYPARKNLGVNEFARGRLTEAERQFSRVLAQRPEDEIAHVHLAEIHFRRRHLANALPHYQRSGARVLSDPVWTVHYATCLLDQGSIADAVALLDRLPADAAATRFDAGAALGRARAFRDAARFFASARPGLADPYAAHYNQMLMLVEAGAHDEAIAVASDLAARGLARAEVHSLASRAHLGAGRIQEAYDALRTAIQLEPSVEQHYVDLALICMDHENFDLGLEIVDIALGRRPDAPTLHLQRGVLLIMKGLGEDAEREFERARVLQPGHPAGAVALAMSWMQSGRTDQAVTLLRRQAGIAPRHAIVAYMLGLALLRSGVDPESDAAVEAMRAFESAMHQDPMLAGPRGELGKLLLKRGQVEAAVTHLEQAVRLDPESASPAYSLAQAYARLGRSDQATALLARVSRLNAAERGDSLDREITRSVVRLVRDGATTPAASRP